MTRFLRSFFSACLFAFALASFASDSAELILKDAKVYPAPNTPPIENATVIIRDGKIQEVTNEKVSVSRSANVIDCKGKVVVAGFWNSHVHFATGWDDADKTPADKLTAHMQEMLTSWGFTTVWDLGSRPENTQAIRKRVESSEVAGPKILMAGNIFPENGHPSYLPAEMQLPEAASPKEAEQMAKTYLNIGLDGIKLFTGVFKGDKPVVNMDTAIVKAAVDVAHGQGKPVFAHPQNKTGTDNALEGGVDILAHTIPTENGFTDDEIARMKQQHTALIPTLTLWTTVTSNPRVIEYLVNSGVSELKQYFSVGGAILFGTDVGFTTNYDTTQEFEFMGRAMPWADVLASLTTNPSDYFKAPAKGRVEKGMDADLVVLDADPAADVKNLAKVDYTIRAGKVIYKK